MTDAEYTIKIIIVINSNGKDAETYIPELYRIASKVYSQSHFEVNWQPIGKTFAQILFIPIRSDNNVPNIDELWLFKLMLKKEMPDFSDIIFHNIKGHNWKATP